MEPTDIIQEKCQRILTPKLRNAIVLGLKDAYEKTYAVMSGFPYELQSRVFGNHLWAESQKQLMEVSGMFGGLVSAEFRRIEVNNFPYLAWTCGDEILLTLKRTYFKDQLADGSDYRKEYAKNIQPRLLEAPVEPEELPPRESMYGVILHGIYPSAEVRTEPSYVTIGIPSVDFKRYIDSVDLLGTFDVGAVEPDIEPELKEEVEEWLVTPKKRKIGE